MALAGSRDIVAFRQSVRRRAESEEGGRAAAVAGRSSSLNFGIRKMSGSDQRAAGAARSSTSSRDRAGVRDRRAVVVEHGRPPCSSTGRSSAGDAANRLFALAMSAALGIPQTLWRDRPSRASCRRRARAGAWSRRADAAGRARRGVVGDADRARADRSSATVYVPGYLGGLLLLRAHGHFEHAGGTVSYYGRLYNVLLFNDGYHVEHHANPGVPWSRLPARHDPRARASAWPAPLRWVERGVARLLEALERLVLRSPMLQRFVLACTSARCASRSPVCRGCDASSSSAADCFRATALILQSLVPEARITVVDSSRETCDRARASG